MAGKQNAHSASIQQPRETPRPASPARKKTAPWWLQLPASRATRAGLWIALPYAVFAALWIFFSDVVSRALAPDAETFMWWSLLKGWAFIGFTAVLLFVLIRREVAAVQKAHAETIDAEDRVRRLLEATSAILWCCDDQGRALDVGAPSWTHFTGISPAELQQPGGWARAVHPEDRPAAEEAWRQAITTGGSYQAEYRLRRRDGAWRNMVTRGVPIHNGEKSVREWAGVCIDITGQRAADEAVRFHAQILDSVGEAVIATDPRGTVIYLNRFAQTLYGWPADEAIGRQIVEIVVPSTSRQQAEEIMTALSAGQTWSGDFLVQSRDGRQFTAHITNSPLVDTAGHLIAIIGVSRDITERQRANAALRESEQRFREIAENIDDVFWIVDLQEHTPATSGGQPSLYVSPAFERVWGFSRETLRHNPEAVIEAVHPDDRAGFLAMREAQKNTPVRFEYRMIRRDGTERVLLHRASPVRNEKGEVVRVAGIVKDITAGKQTEIALRQSEEQLRALASRLNEVREEEAVRIARELHDELGQALTALSLDVAEIERRIEAGKLNGDRPEVLLQLRSVSDALRETIETTRRICTELRPPVLDQLGLCAAIEWQTKEFEGRTGILCDLLLPEKSLRVSDAAATATFRILQEVLTNITRHAHATEVRIELTYVDNELRLHVADNGRGIPEEQIARPSGMGLIGMRERAQAVGGTLRIDRNGGGGTRVELSLPVEEQQP